MCGILGTVNAPFDQCVLDLLKHRGPDDCGLEQMVVDKHLVQLGQQRLSILDLSPAGHQPMHTACNEYSIVFNGEIYNHAQLREKLPKNITFKGHSDTETILYYLKEFGIKGAKDFNGIFTFAFLDKKKKKLFLARDPFGVKPFYCHIGENNNLIFSSEIKPIQALIGSNDLDKEALATLLRLRYNPSPDTLYQHIKKIRPGHYCEVDLNDTDLVVHHHAFLAPVASTVRPTSKNTAKEYGEMLEKAVKRQLLADVEVGIMLSGGIDSALVAALAQKHASNKLKAFTIGFEGNYVEDEIADAAETANVLGLEHYFRKISFTDFLGTLQQCTRIVEEPLATTSMIPMYFLSELAASQVKVVLTGQGADEPLGGYTRYKSELIQSKIPGFLQKPMLQLAHTAQIRNEKILRGINALGTSNEMDRFLAVYEVFSQQEIERLINITDRRSAQRLEYFYKALNCASKSHSAERMMALDTRLNLADDLLNYTDKITMHFSLECRVPMLDLELVAFIESLPLSQKLNLRGGKLIHKQFARDILPDKIIKRKKKAFQSPTNQWFRNEVGSIRDILLSEGSNFSRIFNQRYVAEIIEQHQQGYNKEKQLFLLLGIYFWLDND